MEIMSPSPLRSIYKSRKGRWLCALFFQAFLYGTLPVMPAVVAFLNNNINLELYISTLFGIFAAGLFFAAIRVFQKNIFCYIWMLFLLAVYNFAIHHLYIIVERIHFIQYGILTFFVFHALDMSLDKQFSYSLSFLYITCSGCIDEIIQFYLPNRVCDFKDILLNAFAGILALCLIRLFNHAASCGKKNRNTA